MRALRMKLFVSAVEILATKQRAVTGPLLARAVDPGENRITSLEFVNLRRNLVKRHSPPLVSTLLQLIPKCLI